MQNKPNSNPNKPNCRKGKIDAKCVFTKDYRKNDDFVVRINKPNSNPISVKPKMNVNAFSQKDYENKTAFRPKKTNPIQTQFQTRKNGKNLDSGLSLIFLLTIFNMPSKRQRFGFPYLYLRLPVQESKGAGKAGSL
jgi:hypothetical protein